MCDPNNRPIVLAVCGASGQIYAQWALRLLLQAGRPVELVMSAAARDICRDELGTDDIAGEPDTGGLIRRDPDGLDCPLASGSYPTAGMVICPCTLNTLGAVAAGISDNLIKRAAQVHLKQHRPLVLAIREMPLSLIDLENMVRLARAGAIISPLSGGFYHHPQTIEDLVRFTAERVIEPVTGTPAAYRYPGRSSTCSACD